MKDLPPSLSIDMYVQKDDDPSYNAEDDSDYSDSEESN